MNGFHLTPLLALLIAGLLGAQICSLVERKAGNRSDTFRFIFAFLVFGMFGYASLAATLTWTWTLPALAASFGSAHSLARILLRFLKPWVRWVIGGITHLVLAVAVWLYLIGEWPVFTGLPENLNSEDLLIVLLAYLIVIWPMSSLVGLICQRWIEAIPDQNSLPKAGAWIGVLERVLILTFILVDEFAAIGFLLAAKSILRFGSTQEKDHRKLTEYVLIGTMTSFALTILFGLIVRFLVGLP